MHEAVEPAPALLDRGREESDYAKRRAELADFFGRRWFLLPNPIYGSWERALLSGVCTPSMTAAQCASASTERRYGLLETEGQR